MTSPAVRRPARAVAALALAAALAACAQEPTTPVFYRDLGTPGAQVDPAAALSLINDYRAREDLPAMRLDDRLVRIAAEQAEALAEADSIRLSLEADRRLAARLEAAGYDAGTAVENTSAGYRTLAEAFSGWRDSASHDRNMRDPDVDRFGIATAYAPDSKYRVFWVAIFVDSTP